MTANPRPADLARLRMLAARLWNLGPRDQSDAVADAIAELKALRARVARLDAEACEWAARYRDERYSRNLDAGLGHGPARRLADEDAVRVAAEVEDAARTRKGVAVG